MTRMLYGEVAGISQPVSRIVQGIIQVDRTNEDVGFALLDAAFEAGINCVDTARIYGDADAALGKWMRTRGIRDKVMVLAKCSHHNSLRNRVTPYDIGTDLHDTLAAMQTDYVDLLVLHRDDPAYPVEPIVDAFNQFYREGKVRAFGGSNWTTDRLQQAYDYAIKSGQVPFAVSSPNFSLAEQVKEPWANCVSISGPSGKNQRDWYSANKMPLFTWSSMAGGFWSGKFQPDNLDEFSGYFEDLVKQCYCYPQNFQRLTRAEELAKVYGVTVPQIALSYVLHYPLNIFALVGSANKDELNANIAALHLNLTPTEMEYLDLARNTRD